MISNLTNISNTTNQNGNSNNEFLIYFIPIVIAVSLLSSAGSLGCRLIQDGKWNPFGLFNPSKQNENDEIPDVSTFLP